MSGGERTEDQPVRWGRQARHFETIVRFHNLGTVKALEWTDETVISTPGPKLRLPS